MLINPLQPIKTAARWLKRHPLNVTAAKNTTQTASTKTRASCPHASLTEQAPTPPIAVDKGNPCPFLRGLVGAGLVPNGCVAINSLTDAIEQMVATRDPGTPALPAAGLRAVALSANGFSPAQMAHNARHGVNLNALRAGPFYKHGVDSRTLDDAGKLDEDQLERLAGFATLKTDREGNTELGLNADEINAMLRANFARGAYPGHLRHWVHYPIMQAEYPVLLQVMGKQGASERYLSVAELTQLLRYNQFPKRMLARLTPQEL